MSERKLILVEIQDRLSQLKLEIIDQSKVLEKKDIVELLELVNFYCASYTDNYPIRSYDSASEILGKIDRLIRFEQRYFRWLFILWKNECFKMFITTVSTIFGVFFLVILSLFFKTLLA